jgi:hypothetical protein
MSLRDTARKLKGLGAGLVLWLGLQGALYGQECCGSGCGSGGTPMASTSCHCHRINCPHYCFCLKGAPCIKFKYGCPLPVCEPCSAPNWGYYQPCWRPWPWPPDWSHCPYPVPAAQVRPCPQAAVMPSMTAPTTGSPAPKLLGPGQPSMNSGPGL